MTPQEKERAAVVAADELEYMRMLVNAAREADESDDRSIRKAREKMKQIRDANPAFSNAIERGAHIKDQDDAS